jgi:hypothetical protein
MHSPAYQKFATPSAPEDPMASRVHRLILAAIEADLRFLEQQFNRESLQYPPSMYTFCGFWMLGILILLWGATINAVQPGLATLLAVVSMTLGCLVLLVVYVRDTLVSV